MISDESRNLARDYGVLMEQDEEEEGISLRGLFIIDDRGVLKHITVNDLLVGRSVDEVLRLVQAYQFFEEHGEVCPVDWRPGVLYTCYVN